MPYKIHPAANLFPMMSEADFEALKADIAKNGLQEPLVLWEEQLIDGRNRLKACEELGIEPVDSMLEDIDPFDFVISANLRRRHLKPSQLAMCAAKLPGVTNGRPKTQLNSQLFTQEQAAAMFSVGTKQIQCARKVKEDGARWLVELCEQGKSVQRAAKFIDQAGGKSEQSDIVKHTTDKWSALVAYLNRDKEPKVASVELPDNPTADEVGMVDRWIEQQDDRPFIERFKSLWDSADDIGKAAIRAFVLEAN